MTVEDLTISFDPNGHIEIVSTPIFLRPSLQVADSDTYDRWLPSSIRQVTSVIPLDHEQNGCSFKIDILLLRK